MVVFGEMEVKNHFADKVYTFDKSGDSMLKFIKENPWEIGILFFAISCFVFEGTPLYVAIFALNIFVAFCVFGSFLKDVLEGIFKFINALIEGTLTRQDYKSISIVLFVFLLIVVFLKN